MTTLLNFRDKTIFPPFASLPESNTLVDATPPHRRWCFIGQIISVQATYYFDIELRIMDTSGSFVRVGFASPVEHAEILELQRDILKPAGCIMVLDAVQSKITAAEMGIVISDVSMVKVVPYHLNRLLSFSDKIQYYNYVVDGKRVCYGCGKWKIVLYACSQCRLVCFCNRVCQEVGLYEREHVVDCPDLRDKDFDALLKGRWEDLDHFHSFLLGGYRVEGR
ncbi:hypothetical protein BDV12DRAFT_203199 [Aspergillus spectabilis]